MKVREDADALLVERKGQLPRAFEIRAVSDLGGKFTQRRNFVPELVSCVTRFYEAVGQHVVPWQAPPPKPKNRRKSKSPKKRDKAQRLKQLMHNKLLQVTFDLPPIFGEQWGH